jgi:hypothetical protein
MDNMDPDTNIREQIELARAIIASLKEITYQLALANKREAARDEKKQKPYDMMYNDGWNNALECLKGTVDFTRELPIDVVTRVVGKIKRPIDPRG